MSQLNLPEYKFKIIKTADKKQIFDAIRRKYITLTPEEWVRQNFIQFLLSTGKYPASSIAIEKQLIVNGLKKRYDAVIYDKSFNPRIILEFKAPDVPITQNVFDQVATYNHKLNVDYFIISNGMVHYICQTDKEQLRYIFLNDFPTLD